MKVILSLLFCLPLVAAAESTVFTQVNVLTMESEDILHNHAVVVRGDRIVALGPMDELELPEDARIIEGEGRYLLPGLAEMHGHVPPRNSSGLPERYLEDTLFLYLAGGITTVRGMLGHENQLQLKNDVFAGDTLGPALYLAGPSLHDNSVKSPEDARRLVQEQAEQGWDLIKIHPGLTFEEFKAAAEQAQASGIDFAGHVPEEVGLRRAVELGMRTIDHMDGYLEAIEATERRATDDELQQLAQFTARRNVAVVPTQALWETLIGAADHDELRAYSEARYMPQQVRDRWDAYLQNQHQTRYYTGDEQRVHAQNRQRLLKALHDEGVMILMGTDAPQVYSIPGVSLFRELRMMVEAGLTPYEVLRTGTYQVGEYFAEQDRFGLIAKGYRADLVLTDANPLENIETLAKPQGVMVRGQWLSRQYLDERLDEIEAAYQ